MRKTVIYFTLSVLVLASCYSNGDQLKGQNPEAASPDSLNFKSGYSEVNGIEMYYEIHGSGDPLVLIHGGGSTIETTFGRIIPVLAENHSVIAVELQNHGRSGFRNAPQTFEQDADDVAALLTNIGVSKASFFGFSNGGTTAMQIAIRHPKLVDRLVLAAAAFKRDGLVPGFFNGMEHASLDNMPIELKEAFLKVNPDTVKLRTMFNKDRERMIAFRDMSDEQIKSVSAPTLLISSDADVVTPEHTVEIHRLIPNSRLTIIPGQHGSYIGEITTLSKAWQTTE